MTLHEFIILMTLPIGTSGYNEIQMILPVGTSRYNIRYTSEYIPKLQIHQQLGTNVPSKFLLVPIDMIFPLERIIVNYSSKGFLYR